jgi:uncharacterized coiled-coil protein SlyX
MSTSEPAERTARTWRRALGALLALALGFLPEWAGARAGMVFAAHPGWIAVLILAARDGNAGLAAGLIATAAGVALGAAVAGTEVVTWSRLQSGPNLLAFGACLIVSWISAWHLRREMELRERLLAASARLAESETTIEALREVTAWLRARLDRTWTSLSFLRDVAARLEGSDPVAAAQGAADLALARTGASAAAIESGTNGTHRIVAVRDARGPKAITPPEPSAAQVTVPIRSGNDRVGAIKLWGVPRSGLDDATSYDLGVIAAWCAPALGDGARRPGPPADGGGGAP